MDDKQKLLNRLARAEGQVRGVRKMIEEEVVCSDVLSQLTAVNSSIQKVVRIVAVQNLIDCMSAGDEKKVQDAVDLLLKTR